MGATFPEDTGCWILKKKPNRLFFSPQTWSRVPRVVPIHCMSWRAQNHSTGCKKFSSYAWEHAFKKLFWKISAEVTCPRSYITHWWQHRDWTILLQCCFIHPALLHPKTAAAPFHSLLDPLRDISVLCSVNHNIPMVFCSLSVTVQFYYRSLNFQPSLQSAYSCQPFPCSTPTSLFSLVGVLHTWNAGTILILWGKSSRISLRPICWSLSFLNADGWKPEPSAGYLQSHLKQSFKNTNSQLPF